MKRQVVIGLLFLLALGGAVTAEETDYKPGVLLVRFADVAGQPPDTQTKNDILSSLLGCSCSPVAREYTLVPGLTLVQLPPGVSETEARIILTQSPSILYAELDYELELLAVPSDSRFSELWGLNNTGQTGGNLDADIDAPEAWDIETGSSGVVVAVTDTGVYYTHSDLQDNMWVNTGEIPGNGIDDDGNGYIDDIYGYDTGDNDGDPLDDSVSVYAGHGTHVAGTIGAVGNNGIGVTGICWDVAIMAVKIADANGSMWTDAAVAGIQYATENAADVMNASWGGYSFSQAVYDAIEAAEDEGILFVAGAANDAIDNDAVPFYPASYDLDNIISVMATNHADQITYYSNYGATTVDLAAPGGEQSYTSDPCGILSTVPQNGYDFYQGTSMASPHVAGACAFLLSADPTLSYTDVKQILLTTVDPIEGLDGLCVSGGRLNIYNAVQEVVYDTMPPDPCLPDWDMEPTATGLHTIAMKAEIVTDRSGVEYYFECVNDVNYNSGWLSTRFWEANDANFISEGTTYGFRFKARDKSDAHNETGWSPIRYATTTSGVDDLPPAPNPSRWAIKPKVHRLTPLVLRMRAETATDESDAGGVEYYFEETTGTGINSGWQTSDFFQVTSGISVDNTYTFRFRTRDRAAPANYSGWSTEESLYVSSGAGGGSVLTVPFPYVTIQSAIDAAQDGDIVQISPGVYRGWGNRDVIFSSSAAADPAKVITVRSVDPEDPDIVAATIIDCQGSPTDPHRGFLFIQGEKSNSILAGLTIINGYAVGANGDNGDPGEDGPDPGINGGDGGDGQNGRPGAAGAILCGPLQGLEILGWTPGDFKAGSPTIRNCVITDCVAAGGAGGDGGGGGGGGPGDEGDPEDPNFPPVPPGNGGHGGDGGDGSDALGGGIYSSSGSHPTIDGCAITSCTAIAGTPGDGGNGGAGGTGVPDAVPPIPDGAGGNGGNGGLPGWAFGGGIYAAPDSRVLVIDSTVSDCNAFSDVYGGPGGAGGPGDPPGVPGIGLEGVMGLAFGGGVYCGLASTPLTISGSTITNNQAGILGLGGGVYFDSADGGTIVSYITKSQDKPGYIAGNYAPIGGGVYYFEKGRLVIEDTNFVGNGVNPNPDPNIGDLYTEVGGAVLGGLRTLGSSGGQMQITNCNFTQNTGAYGGAVYLDDFVFLMEGTTFSNNMSLEGGGLNLYDCALDIDNCAFRNNSAEASQLGLDGLGGGMACWNSGGQIRSSVFLDNTAAVFGGGLFVEGWSIVPVELINCLVADNSALLEGGGLSCNTGGWARMTNCTVTGNAVYDLVYGSGGAVSCAEHFAWVELQNSILWDNTGPSGAQIAVGTVYGSDPYGPYADVDVNYCDVQGGQDNVFLEDPDYTAVWWFSGNINADPLFADIDVNDPGYYLSQVPAGQLEPNSPCVDAGDGSAGNLEAMVGLSLTTRTDHIPDSGTVDMGYHYDAGAPVQMYQLRIEVVDGIGGRLSAEATGSDPFVMWDPNTRLVQPGTIVSLQALADKGFVVLNWTGTDDDATTAASNIVTMNADKVVRVAFHQYVLTIAVDGNEFAVPGRLIATSDYPDDPFTIMARQDSNSRAVTPGIVVDLQAEPNDGYRVMQWTGSDDDASTALTNAVTMDMTKTVSVAFEPTDKYYLTVRLTGNGSIFADGQILPNPARIEVPMDSVVTLSANRDDPSEVIIWQGTDDDYSSAPTNTVTMTGHREVNVEFYAPHLLYVGADSEYQTIQLAIEAAQDRDIVMVTPGTYDIRESSEDNPYLLISGKDIILTSISPEDPTAVTIIGGFIVQNVSRYNVIQGFTITDAMYFKDYEMGTVHDVDPNTEWHWATPDGEGVDGYGGGTCRGGGMELYDDASPTVRNCVFVDCAARGYHGANGAGGTGLDGYSGNGGPGGKAYGGAAYCGLNGSPLFENCSFTNCSAQGGDGGNGGDAAPAVGGHGGAWGDNEAPWWDEWNALYGFIHGPLEDYWKYTAYGGAIYCDTGSTAEFVDCEFADNTAIGGSCGISGASTPSGWPSQHYKIDCFGGALYVAQGSSPTFTDCTFTNNTADIDGPPTSRKDDEPTVNAYVNISYGGAVAFEEGATPLFENCQFDDNLSTVGGAMYGTWSEPTIADSNFVNNSAYHGGAALIVGGTTHVLESNFLYNESTLAGAQGGGLTLLGADAELIDCTIMHNQTTGQGGGLYLSSQDILGQQISARNDVLLWNCLIAGNFATQGGGGIAAVWHADPNIVNCTIANNSGSAGNGGGLLSSYGNYACITDSILWGNLGAFGSQIAIETESNPSWVKVGYSDVQGGAPEIYVADGATLEWEMTNIHEDPLFVNDTQDDYHLSQIPAGQDDDSPAVNAGSAPASDLGFFLYTTRTDDVPDRGIVDMGYHYPMVQPCRFVDVLSDGIINFGDFAILAAAWLDAACSDANAWCAGADFTYDGFVVYDDLSILTDCWLAEDTIAPIPNPAQWYTEPYSDSNSTVAMVAVEANDILWGLDVQYYFTCQTENGCHDSGWQSDANYTDTNLAPDTEYGYSVRTRDIAGNETESSPVRYAITGGEGPGPGDTTPPTGLAWIQPPTATASDTIEMEAIAADESGVQYLFEETTGTGSSSGWTNNPAWQDTGLDPNTQYCYRVTARDNSPNHNETGYIGPLCATTPPPGVEPDANAPAPPPTILISPDVNTVADPCDNTLSGQYWLGLNGWHKVVADVTGITDDSGGDVEIRFICIDDPALSSTTKVPQPPAPLLVGGAGAYGDVSLGWRVTYEGSSIIYDVDINKYGIVGRELRWKVCAYDIFDNEACSAVHTIGPPPLY